LLTLSTETAALAPAERETSAVERETTVLIEGSKLAVNAADLTQRTDGARRLGKWRS
jgi:hypothetical protein